MSFLFFTSFVGLALPSKCWGRYARGPILAQSCRESFEKTLSPFASRCSDAFEIKKKADGFEFIRIYNFHEGASGMIEDVHFSAPQNEYTFHASKDLAGFLFRLKVLSGGPPVVELTEMREIEPRTVRIPYSRLPESFDALYNRALIGDYRNAKGERFTFDASGKGLWAGRPMSYQVSDDLVTCAADHVEIQLNGETKGQLHAWERRGSKVIIFKDDFCEDNTEKPKVMIEELIPSP